jgi:hypothetical protein
MGDTLEGQKKKAPRRRLFPSARIYRPEGDLKRNDGGMAEKTRVF